MGIDELNAKFGAPGRIVFRRGFAGYPCAVLANRYGTAEIALLGAVAVRSRTAFGWDKSALRCDNPAAQKFISKTYRMF